MTDEPIEPVAPSPDDLTIVRQLIVDSFQDVVPELITGASIADLVASVAPARDAFNRIATRSTPVHIPAGGNTPVVIDADALPTSEKIRRGLAAHQRKA